MSPPWLTGYVNRDLKESMIKVHGTWEGRQVYSSDSRLFRTGIFVFIS